jgi:type IV pilus assembly protein PilE
MNMERKIVKQKGFTLLELMMVAAIIAILASVALPSYQNYTKKARIADATSALADYRVKYENYFLDNKTYPAASATCLPTTNSSPALFTVSCVSDTSTYTITATGNGQMSNFNYTIDYTNTKTSNTPWGNSASCWIKSSGGSC